MILPPPPYRLTEQMTEAEKDMWMGLAVIPRGFSPDTLFLIQDEIRAERAKTGAKLTPSDTQDVE